MPQRICSLAASEQLPSPYIRAANASCCSEAISRLATFYSLRLDLIHLGTAGVYVTPSSS